MKYYFLLLPFLYGCFYYHGNGASRTIDESKKMGVFVCEYDVPQNPYLINDSLKLTIKESWLEKTWVTTENHNIIIKETYQLCINSVKEDLKNIDFYWTIGLNGDHYLKADSKNSLLGDFKSLPRDTIEYKVQQGDNLSDFGAKKVIGKLILIKKV